MSYKAHNKTGRRFRFTDLLVILICLAGAVCCLNLFRLDLFNTLDSQTEQPVGTIIIKNNIVQRRIADRVLWDRLIVDAPVYSGDLIRTAELSAAMLILGDNNLDMDENTLLRITGPSNGDDAVQIELSEGTLGLTSGTGTGIRLNFSGHEVEITPGTILNASSGDDGMALSVIQGSAIAIGEQGERREIPSGSMLSLDSNGIEQMKKAVVVTHPLLNARYLKSSPELVSIRFDWNRFNLEPEETLRLEIAQDRSFSRIVQDIDGLSSAAEAAVDEGQWYYRLSTAGGESVGEGRFTVVAAMGPRLISPVLDSTYRTSEAMQIRYQWSDIPDASFYIIEISQSPDFTGARRMQTSATFIVDETGLQPGTWYWRVMPVFPSVYEGSSAFSPVSLFHVELGNSGETGLVLPDPVREQPVTEEPEPPVLRLLSPAAGTSVAGLTALRQQTVFTWDSEGEVESSRFILSRNANPLQGQPVREIRNPGQTVRIDGLAEGVYYWTIEAAGPGGRTVATARQLRVLAIPTLPAPANLSPSDGYRIGIEQLKESRSIAFAWSAVAGANAYIVTLFEQTAGGQRQITRTAPLARTGWTLDDVNVLVSGNYVWQVESVNRNQAGTIEQRGRAGEGTFVVDVPPPEPVQIDDPGVFYVK